MTLAHWIYVVGILFVVVTMLFRRNVVIPCMVFTLVIGWLFKGSFIGGILTVFNASLIAAQDLFSIFLIIALMVMMLKSISITGADELMVKPLKRFMISPAVSYLILIVATYVISLFFWPTPAVPLIGALLVPVAIRAGLPPMLGAMALALAGQGMALSGDVIIQGAPGLTAKAAGIPVALATNYGGILSLITGLVAIILGYFMMRSEIKNGTKIEIDGSYNLENSKDNVQLKGTEYAKPLVLLVSISMVLVVVAMSVFQLKGGDASALLGGTAVVITIIASMLVHKSEGFDKICDYISDGFVFAFKVMGPIIPIAGFFYLGNPETAVKIMGEGATGYLFDIGKILAASIPAKGFLSAFGILLVGMIAGLDGSGFVGLPMTGTLAGAMAGGDPHVAAALGAIGQMGSVWSGGGTIVAWSSLVAVAGIVGVPVMDLVRKNFIPVMTGLIISTIVGVMVLM
ncbi:MAG TPA: hypothetical protein GXX35_03085 [Thermoanaerobacterales bacterium]|nr:hypothetical protein [Thermoanaerobacterales bacterium]